MVLYSQSSKMVLYSVVWMVLLQVCVVWKSLFILCAVKVVPKFSLVTSDFLIFYIIYFMRVLILRSSVNIFCCHVVCFHNTPFL